MLKNKLALALALVAALMLPACATKPAGPDFQITYYPECYDPIDQMCKAQDNTGKAKGAAVGALFGAITGAALGAAATGDAKGAIIGGIAGAAVGGAAGYGIAHLNQIKDQKERLEALQAQLGQQANEMDLQQASVEKAYRCYRDRIAELKKGIKSGKISKKEAMARADEIRAGMSSLRKFWEGRDAAMQASLNEYDTFLANQEKEARDKANKRRIAESRKARAKMASNASKYVAANSKEEAESLRALDDMRLDLDRA